MQVIKVLGLFLILCALLFSADVFGISPSPEVIERLKAEGKLQEWIDFARTAREKGAKPQSTNQAGSRRPAGD